MEATSGAGMETLDYYPFGGTRVDNKASSYGGSKRKFIGQINDAGTTLDYLNARYYDGSKGQFVSEDPVFLGIGSPQLNALINGHVQDILADPQLLNAYSYARDNPISRSDPSGKLSASQTAQISATLAQISAALANISAILSNPGSGGGHPSGPGSGGSSSGSGGVPVISVGGGGSSNNYGVYQASSPRQAFQSTPYGFNISGTYSVGLNGGTSSMVPPSGNSISPGRHTQLVVAGVLGAVAGALDDYSHLGDVDNSASTIAISLAAGGIVGPEAIPVVAVSLEVSYYGAQAVSTALYYTEAYLKK